jgi:tetratricopeptide (TPR) repeat protein
MRHLAAARDALETGRLDEALPACRLALEELGEDSRVYLMLARVLQAQAKYAKAETVLEKAALKDPADLRPLQALSKLHRETAAWARLAAVDARWLAVAPPDHVHRRTVLRERAVALADAAAAPDSVVLAWIDLARACSGPDPAVLADAVAAVHGAAAAATAVGTPDSVAAAWRALAAAARADGEPARVASDAVLRSALASADPAAVAAARTDARRWHPRSPATLYAESLRSLATCTTASEAPAADRLLLRRLAFAQPEWPAAVAILHLAHGIVSDAVGPYLRDALEQGTSGLCPAGWGSLSAFYLAAQQPLTAARCAERAVETGESASAAFALPSALAHQLLAARCAGAGRAHAALGARSADDARMWFRRALEASDQCVSAHVGLALLEIDAGDSIGAVNRLRSCAGAETDPEALALLGRALVSSGDPAASLIPLCKSLELDGSRGDAHRWLGEAHFDLGGDHRRDRGLAMHSFVRALQCGVSDAHVYYLLGKLYQEDADDVERARRCYRRALDLSPSHEGAGRALTALLEARGEHSLAVDVYDEICRRSPRSHWALERLAAALIRAGRLEEAVQRYQSILRLDPAQAGAWRGLASVYLRLGRYVAALRSFERAIALDGADTDSLYQIARVQQLLGRDKDAALRFRELLRLSPNHLPAMHGLALALSKLARFQRFEGRFDVALRTAVSAHEAVQRCLLVQDDLYCLWKLRGDVSLMRGVWTGASSDDGGAAFFASAVESFERCLELRVDAAWAHYDIGITRLAWARSLQECGIFSDSVEELQASARSSLEAAVRADSGNGMYWSALGHAFLVCAGGEQHARPVAHHCFLRGLQLGRQHAVCHAALGFFYLSCSLWELAHRVFEQGRIQHADNALLWHGFALLHASQYRDLSECRAVVEHSSHLARHSIREVNLLRGMISLLLGDTHASVDALRKYISAAAGSRAADPAVYHALSVQESALEMHDDAVAHADRALHLAEILDAHPTTWRACVLNAARSHWRAGNPALAAQLLDRLTTTEKDMEVRLYRAMLLAPAKAAEDILLPKIGEPTLPLDWVVLLMAHARGRGDLAAGRALCAVASACMQEATTDALSAGVAALADLERVLYGLTRESFALQEFKVAWSACAALDAHCAPNPLSPLLRACITLQAKQRRAARTLGLRAFHAHPTDVDAWCGLAELFLAISDATAAELQHLLHRAPAWAAVPAARRAEVLSLSARVKLRLGRCGAGLPTRAPANDLRLALFHDPSSERLRALCAAASVSKLLHVAASREAERKWDEVASFVAADCAPSSLSSDLWLESRARALRLRGAAPNEISALLSAKEAAGAGVLSRARVLLEAEEPASVAAVLAPSLAPGGDATIQVEALQLKARAAEALGDAALAADLLSAALRASFSRGDARESRESLHVVQGLALARLGDPKRQLAALVSAATKSAPRDSAVVLALRVAAAVCLNDAKMVAAVRADLAAASPDIAAVFAEKLGR